MLFRIEVEEVIAHSIFDQNKDGLVSQDEINVSLVYKLIINNISIKLKYI